MLKGISVSLGRQDVRRLTIVAAAVFASVFVVLAIIGVMGMFSPVPFWDMWDGGLAFYLATSSGDFGLWFAQHNEHRVVLSRLLFWLDYEVFGGMAVFLIVMNYVIVAMAVLLFWRIALARLAGEKDHRYLAAVVACFMTAWLYQWIQSENLGWSFQSQFFLAQLLPVLAFYLLHKSVPPDATVYPQPALLFFALACLTGIASAGTMANGVLALPLMTVYALIVRMRWWQVFCLAVVSMLILGLYFYDYYSPGHHGSLSEAILQTPLQLAFYIALYLGTPFYYLFGQALSGTIAAVSATFIMALVSLTCLYQGVRNPRANTLKLALVFGVVYLVGTAVGTGGGRLIFGVSQALSSRYSTPALMAWACILMLVLPGLWRTIRRFPLPGGVLIAALLGPMVTQQLKVLKPDPQLDHLASQRNVAGLALELRILDEAQINQVYPAAEPLLRRTAFMSQNNLAFFGAYPWRDLNQTIGTLAPSAHLPACSGNVDLAEVVPTDPSYIRVDGWLINNEERVIPELITITSPGGYIAGYALAGVPRADVADTIGSHAGRAGFRGYVRADLIEENIILIADKAPCELITDLP